MPGKLSQHFPILNISSILWVLLIVWQIVNIKICFWDLIVTYLWQHPTLWLCCPWNLRQFSFHQRTNTSRTPLLSDPWCKKHKVIKFIEKNGKYHIVYGLLYFILTNEKHNIENPLYIYVYTFSEAKSLLQHYFLYLTWIFYK